MIDPQRPYPTDQPVPAGFERLSSIRDRIGAEPLLAKLQSGEIESFEFRSDDGEVLPVAVQDWRSAFASAMIQRGYKQHYFSPEPPKDPASPRDVFSYGSDWRLLIVRAAGVRPSANSPRKTGAPLKYDWARAAGFTASFVVENDPQTKGEVGSALRSWFDRQAKVPDDKDIRAFVDALWSELKGKA